MEFSYGLLVVPIQPDGVFLWVIGSTYSTRWSFPMGYLLPSPGCVAGLVDRIQGGRKTKYYLQR